MPFCLPGLAKPPTQSSLLEWHCSGVLACAVENSVVFLDSAELRVVQTLTKHNSAVSHLTFQPGSSIHPETLLLASADVGGTIFVWDVVQGLVLSKIAASSNPVNLRWLSRTDAQGRRPYVVVLLKHTFSMFDAFGGNQLWVTKLNASAVSLDFDPFCTNKLAVCSSSGLLMFMDHMTSTQPPRSSPDMTLDVLLDKSTISHLKYSRAYPDRLFVVMSDRISLVHAAVRVVLCNISIGSVPVWRIFPCKQRDAFYIVYSNGQVSLLMSKIEESKEDKVADLFYSPVCSSEVQRASLKNSVYCAALNEMSESHIAVISSAGRLIFYELRSHDVPSGTNHSCDDHIKLDDNLANVAASDLRLSQYAHLKAIGTGVTSVRVRPMNLSGFESDLDNDLLIAVATSSGSVCLANLMTCDIVREFHVHSGAIKCLEWGGSDLVISAASTLSLSSASVRNDLKAMNIRTGQKYQIRPESDESPIEMIKVSHFHCYLAVSFRHHPLEIWDLRSMKLLRRMSKRCPVIIDVAWFGKHAKNGHEDQVQNVIRENLVVLDVDNHLYHVVVKGLHVRDGKEVNTDWTKGSASLSKVVWKDDFLVFGDTAGMLRIWDLAQKKNRDLKNNNVSRGPVVRMVFSPMPGDYTLAVMHPQQLVLWDAEGVQVLQEVEVNGFGMADVDMCGVTPVYLAADGCVRYGAHGEHLCPSLPDNEQPRGLRHFCKPASDVSAVDSVLELFNRRGVLEMVKMIKSKDNLPPYMFLYWPAILNKRRLELEVMLLSRICSNSVHLDYIVEKSIVLGDFQWANSLLLKSGRESSSDIRSNSFKACLLASHVQDEECRCVVKMVATNLIASGWISDGIQLLYLINQAEDACKYLMAAQEYERACSYGTVGPILDRDQIAKCLLHLQPEGLNLEYMHDNNWALAETELDRLGGSALAKVLLPPSRSDPADVQHADQTLS